MKHLDSFLRHLHTKEKPQHPTQFSNPPPEAWDQGPVYSQPAPPPNFNEPHPPNGYDRPAYNQPAYGQPPYHQQFYNQPPPNNGYAGPPPSTFVQNAPPASCPPASRPSTEPLSVFAHFLVGVAGAMSQTQWESDIIQAQKSHIDGFALNIAPQDGYTDRVLQTAYDAAEKIGNFSLFIAFDYASGGPWPPDRVISLINTYKSRRAQYNYKGKPLVSTFEGVGNSGDWTNIKNATGCAFMPCWTSLAPSGLHTVMDKVDGAFSWDAWPVGAEDKNSTSDVEWMKSLSGKPYMMAVSPWFYTNLPQWNKNWLWRGDDLWHYRWKQVIDLQPALVQILSWNDYGETHYIGPIHEQGIPDGASRYVSGHPHDAWRILLPHYIDAYRRRNAALRQDPDYTPRRAISYTDKVVYWYRLNPSNSGSANGTTGNCPNMGQPELKPSEVAQDRVFVSVLVTQPSDVYVQIGQAEPTILFAPEAGVNHYSVPFNGQTGPVNFMIVREGRETVSTTGPAITEQCTDGIVNWNAYVGTSD